MIPLWIQALASLAGVGIGVLIALWIDAAARVRRSRRQLQEAEARAERLMRELIRERDQPPAPRRRVRLVDVNAGAYRRMRAARHRAGL